MPEQHIKQKHNAEFVKSFTESGKVVTTKTKTEAAKWSEADAADLIVKHGDQFEAVAVS